MSPFLFDADLASTDLGRHARRVALVPLALSITDLFTEFAEARKTGDTDRMKLIRQAVKSNSDKTLAAEFDGFDYPAAA
jgi:hypothetical protein